MEKTLRWLNLLLVCLTFLCYLSPFVDPASFWLFSFLGMAYPWFLLFNLLFILFWIFSKKWYFLFSVGCVLLGWNHFQSFVGLNTPLPKSKEELTVMTMNSMKHYNLRGKTKERFDQTLADFQPDVILLQETKTSAKPISRKKYPHLYLSKNKKLAIYSKYPFTKKGNMDFKSSVNGCVFVDMEIRKQKIRIYNVHLQSNGVSDEAAKVKKEGNLQDQETWTDIRGMLGKVKRNAVVRSKQAKTIINHLKKSENPVIVGGDFNETPLSYTYQLFSNHLKDGFKQRAAGVGTTYGGVIPVLRIDYIWTDPKFHINSHKIIRENFSDHYPVISRIQLP